MDSQMSVRVICFKKTNGMDPNSKSHLLLLIKPLKWDLFLILKKKKENQCIQEQMMAWTKCQK